MQNKIRQLPHQQGGRSGSIAKSTDQKTLGQHELWSRQNVWETCSGRQGVGVWGRSWGRRRTISISSSWARMRVQSLQSCPTLCNPMDCSPPGSSVPGILQARILEWVAWGNNLGSWSLDTLLLKRGADLRSSLLPLKRCDYLSPCPTLNVLESVQFSSVAQSCPTLCHPMDRSTPGFPVHHQILEFTQTQVH